MFCADKPLLIIVTSLALSHLHAQESSPPPPAAPLPSASGETDNARPGKHRPLPQSSAPRPIPSPSLPPTTPSPTPADPAQTRAAILALKRELSSPKRDVRQIIAEMDRRLTQLGNVDDEELRAARVALVEAMEKTRMWQPMLRTLFRCRASSPQFPRPAWEAEPLIGLNLFKQAQFFLTRLSGQYPQDAEVDIWKANLADSELQWSESLTAATNALTKASVTAAGNLPPPLLAKARFYKYHALLYQNQIPAAESELDEALKIDPARPEFQQARRVLANAKSNKVIYSAVCQEIIPLGIYHLYTNGEKPSLAGSIYSLSLTTLTTEPRNLRAEVQIPGVTETMIRDLVLLPGQTVKVNLSPPLKFDFDATALRAERPAELTIRLTDVASGKSLLESAFPVQVLPFDFLPLEIKTRDNSHIRRYEFAGAWITPNSRDVETFLSAAKKRMPGKNFDGSQSASLPQVQAIFDELKSMGVSYVTDPEVFSDFGRVQRTRLPKVVLASHNAQCAESSLLFASLLESIGLRPFIVHVPGHMFVGWEPTPSDHAPPRSVYYLETTMVGGPNSFDQALKYAWNTVQKNVQSGEFRKGTAFVLKVTDMRKAGVTPQPYQ